MTTDWDFINRYRIRAGQFGSTIEDGFNGAFSFPLQGEPRRVLAIASDGLGWRHVSVSFGENHAVPSWRVMCEVKRLFFGDDEWVIEFHPPKEQYVNNHPGCLHLWQPTDEKFPTPDSLLVGLKGIECSR